MLMAPVVAVVVLLAVACRVHDPGAPATSGAV
jgi:hypothetical protein